MLGEAGISTIDADAVGHEVLAREGAAFERVVERWPGIVEDDQINRSALAEVVFNDRNALQELEAITHPHIFDTIRARVEETTGPVVVEMPLLSAGLGPDWKRVVVDCRDEVCVRRAISRGMTERDARARMLSQPGRPTWLASADLVIPNHSGRRDLEQCVVKWVSHI